MTPPLITLEEHFTSSVGLGNNEYSHMFPSAIVDKMKDLGDGRLSAMKAGNGVSGATALCKEPYVDTAQWPCRSYLTHLSTHQPVTVAGSTMSSPKLATSIPASSEALQLFQCKIRLLQQRNSDEW